MSAVLRIEILQYSCVFASEFLSLWMSKSKHTLPSHFKHLNFPMPKCSQKMCSFLSFSSVQFSCSVMSYFLPPHGLQQARVPVHQQLPELTQTHVHWVLMLSNHLILCRPLLLLLSVFHSIRVFSNESVLRIRWTKYWSFSISPSNEYSGLISSKMDWFDLLAVHRTLKSLL